VRTDRLDFFGLALLTASLALFSAASIIREVAASSVTPATELEAATTVDIAIRARAEGRAAQADSLLASLAARNASLASTRSGRLHDSALGSATTACLSGLALAFGISGLSCVVLAAGRRRRTFELVSAELEQPAPSDDPGRLVVGLYRLRAEREAAQSDLRRALRQLEQGRGPTKPHLQTPGHSVAEDSIPRIAESNPQPFHDLGRIVEITAIDPDCSFRDRHL
jgi:hypothetical protein